MTSQQTSLEEEKSQIAFQQEQTEESATTDQRVLAYLNRKKIEKVDVQVAKTLMARDWKGFGTSGETMNGVIEHDKGDGT